MDASIAASSHKENVHIAGGMHRYICNTKLVYHNIDLGAIINWLKFLGKTTSLVKTDKLKPARTAGKERKALVDLKNNFEPTVVASKDVDFKQKPAIIGKQVKSNPKIVGKENKIVAELCSSKKPPVSELSKRTNPSTKSALLESLGKGNTYLGHVLTCEEIQRCYEWAKDGIEEMGGYSWSAEDETRLFLNQDLSEIMASAIGVPISELESSFRVC